MVSFSSFDSKYVDELEGQLSYFGIKLVRYERDIEPQQRINRFIEGFSNCDIAFVILSADYFKSPICILELISIASIPDKAFLITVPESGEGITAAAAIGLKKMESEYALKKNVDWIGEYYSTVDWDKANEAVRSLLAKRFLPVSQLQSSYGVRSYLKTINYTPESFAETLHLILSYEDLTERERAFDKYLETGFRGDSFLYAKGISYEMAEYYKLALDYFFNCLSISPDYVASYVRICRIALVASAEIQSEAFGMLDKLRLEGNISDADQADVSRAKGLLSLKKYEVQHEKQQLLRAKEYFEKSAQIERSSAILNNLAQVYETLGDSRKAGMLYEEAIRLDNKNYFALNNLALLEYRSNPIAAKKLFKRALAINPSYQPSINGLAIACEDESPEDSMFRYLEIACLNYELSEALTNAALIAEEKFSEPKTARTLYRLALLKNPEGLASNYNYATFLRRVGASTKEVEHYYNIARRAGKSVLVDLGYILLRLRDGELSDAVMQIENLPIMVSPQAIQAVAFLRLYIAIKSSAELCTETLTNLLPVNEIEFWPYADIAGRVTYNKSEQGESLRYFSKAKYLNKVTMPRHEGRYDEDFGLHFDFFESQMPFIFGERISKRQIVRINDDAKERIASEAAKRI